MGGGKGGGNSYQMDADAVRAQTAANRANQYTPWGSLEWTNDGGDKWTQRVTLSPDQQAALDAQMQTGRLKSELANSMFGRVAKDMGTEMDWGNLPSMEGPQQQWTSMTGQLTGIPGADQLRPYQDRVAQTTGADMANLKATGQQTGIDKSDLTGRAKADADERNRIESMLMERMNPQFDQDRQALETRLLNQGVTKGSTAYNRAMQQQGDQQNRAKFDAMQTAGNEMKNLFDMQFQNRGQSFGEALQGGQFTNQALNAIFGQNQGVQSGNLAAQQQQFGQGLAAGQFANQARQQQFADLLNSGKFSNDALNQLFQQGLASNAQNFQQGLQSANFNKDARTQLLQERQAEKMQNLNFLNAILGGTQVGTPQFSNYAQADRANAQLLNQPNSTMGDIGNLAKTGMQAFTLFSDRRLKSDIERIGEHPLGIGIYSYTIFGEPQIGVMADEVEKVMPAAVHEHESGFKMVDYAMIGGNA